MKYFKLSRNDGVYWLTPNISKLLADMGMIQKERLFRICYTDEDYRVKEGGYEYFLEKFKGTPVEFGMFQNDIMIKSEQAETTPEKMEVSENEIKAERLFTRKPQTLEEVTKMFEIDTSKWECTKFTVSNWDVTSTKAGRTATNYAVKAEFKKRTSLINYDEFVNKFIKDVELYKPIQIEKTYEQINKTGNLLELPIMDLHFGKLSWGKETGEDYDSKIAEERFLSAVKALLNPSAERILYVLGSDFFNFDTIDGTTTKGTRQDNDVRWQKMFSKGCEVLVKAVDMMLSYAPVDIIYIPGNHDYQTSYYATSYLQAWYRNHKNVTIDASPTSRKYYKWGNSLIGFTHGNEEKNRLSGIMQIEAPKEWGDSLYREFHTGHLHSEHTREENGVIIRNISSVTGSDAWHNRVGFIGAIKKAQGFLWNKDDGLIQIQNYVIR